MIMSNGLPYPAFIGPGGPEVIVVMLVLLLLFGAKDAPKMFRKLNELLSQIRSTAEHFKQEVMYGDLTHESTSDDAAGEYDEFGLTSSNKPPDGNDNAVKEPHGAEEVETAFSATEALAHEGETDGGERGDVKKT